MPDYRVYDGAAGDNAFDTATNWSDDTAPISGDSADFPAMDAASTKDVAGSDQSAILLVNLTVAANNYLNFGSRLTPLHVDADYFVFEGGGYGFFQIDNSTEVRVLNAPSASSGYSYGVEFTGASNALLVLDPGSSGSVGVAVNNGQTAAFTSIVARSGNITLGAAVTCTTFSMDGGTAESSSDSTTLNVNAGTFTQAKNKPTTLNLNGGRLYYNSVSAPTTINAKAGVLDFSRDGRAKVWSSTTINLYPGATIYDPGNVLSGFTLVKQKGGTLQIA